MSETGAKGRGRGWLVMLGIFVVPALLCCGGGGLWWGGRSAAANRKIEGYIADIKSRQLPTDNESLSTYYKANSSKEAGEAWNTVLKGVTSAEYSADSKDLPILGNSEAPIPQLLTDPWPEQEKVAAFLAKYEGISRQIDRAAALKGPAQFDIEFDSIATLLPHAQNSRIIARHLNLQFEVALRKKDQAEQIRAIRNAHALSQSLSAESFFVGYLVKLAVTGIGHGMIIKSLENGQLDESGCREVRKLLEQQTDFGNDWRQAIVGERAAVLPMFQDPTVLRRVSDSGSIGGVGLGVLPNDTANYLEIMSEMEKAPTENIDEFLAKIRDVESKVEKEMEGNFFSVMERRLSSNVLPSLSACGNAVARTRDRSCFLIVALAITEFQRKNGRWPANLSELESLGVPASTIQPVGGKPFGYQVKEDAVLLWGFDLMREKQVPDEPPVPAGEDQWQGPSWLINLKVQ